MIIGLKVKPGYLYIPYTLSKHIHLHKINEHLHTFAACRSEDPYRDDENRKHHKREAFKIYLPDERATSFNAINKLSPSTKAKDRLTQPG